MGSSTEHSAFGPTRNPWDLDRIPGGSGGGSAAAVAAFEAPLALGTDTGGSIRQPGAVTGTVGVKPTYGGVSRYGAIAMASSLDQIGPVSRTVLDSAAAAPGHRRARPARLHLAARPPGGPREPPPGAATWTGMQIGIIKELHGEGYQAGVENRFNEALELLKDAGAEIVEVSCPNFKYALGAYYLIMPSEASSNLAKFDGVRYGTAGPARGRPLHHRTRHGRHPRGRLRRRGQAPHHPGHLRPLRRLLRRLLRLGAEGPHPGPARLRRGVRPGRRADLPDRPDHGLQAGREARRPAGHVPQRRRHHSGQPGRRPGHLGARRPGRGPARRASSSWPRPARTPACTAPARPWRPCSRAHGAARCWTQAPELEPVATAASVTAGGEN